MRKVIRLRLTNGQVATHRLFGFKSESEYQNWCNEFEEALPKARPGNAVLAIEGPYTLYRLEHIVGLELVDPPKDRPPIRLIATP
jgi:hypothetical protein